MLLEGVNFKSILEEDNSCLVAPFTVEKIREAMWDCDENKSLGLHDFNLH